MWTSWPHACITGTVLPCASVTVFVEAYGRPVASRPGSASMSALNRDRAGAVREDADHTPPTCCTR